MPLNRTQPALPGPGSEHVPAARQWISETDGRIAPDGYSWLQAVCWAHLDSSYRRSRGHGPRHIGETTLRVAVELARLAPCRPGVDYLVRVLRLSRRTVQYHLKILREAGLLAYRSRGTRVRSIGGRASEFVWTIPQAFDTALHLITRACDRYIRALQGIAEEGRALMKRLATMARKVMRRRNRASLTPPGTRTSGTTRCTPMGGGSHSSSAAGGTPFPPETKLDRGKSTSPTPKKTKRHRSLNAVGRRYQLARELIEQVDWLHGCSTPRIAWIVREVSDAGWTVREVRAWLHLRGETTRVRRPSGFLDVLLRNAVHVLDTQAKRADAVARWHDADEAARRNRIHEVRARAERLDGHWQAPRSAAVRRMVTDAFAPSAGPQQPAEALPALGGPQDLTEEDLEVMRSAAQAEYMQGETALITSAIEAFGRHIADAMYGLALVQRALQLSRHSSRMSLTHRQEFR
ncbi:helix-turn-helix domain-containing protein [Streptomyces qinglanensis]|uniref:helix-turn-helix domain-containing protein n=1 Tax=Streptomyces qinglanensis TaxID=943816 RepID=UPI003D73415B